MDTSENDSIEQDFYASLAAVDHNHHHQYQLSQS